MTEEQKEIYHLMVENQPDIITFIASFDNNDVPKYLENLRWFEDESRKVDIVIK